MLLDYTQNCTMVVFDGWSTNICKKIVQKYLQKYNQNICKKILPKYLEKYYQNAKQILVMIDEGVRGGLIWTGSAQNCTNTNHATYFSFLLFGRINLKQTPTRPSSYFTMCIVSMINIITGIIIIITVIFISSLL